MATDFGRPSSLIRFSTLHASTDSASCPDCRSGSETPIPGPTPAVHTRIDRTLSPALRCRFVALRPAACRWAPRRHRSAGRFHRRQRPAVARTVVPAVALLVEPQPPPAPLPESSPHRFSPASTITCRSSEGPPLRGHAAQRIAAIGRAGQHDFPRRAGGTTGPVGPHAYLGRLVQPGVEVAAGSRRVRRPSPPRGRARCRRAPERNGLLLADSGANRSPIPAETDHRFRSKPITLSRG